MAVTLTRSLTYKQVLETGAKAWTVASRQLAGDGPCADVEAVFEYGHAWLMCFDEEGLVCSSRQLAASEIPQAGWHHHRKCRCRYCDGGES